MNPGLSPITERLAEHVRLLDNIVAGRTPSLPIGEVRARMLADDLRDAIEIIRQPSAR